MKAFKIISGVVLAIIVVVAIAMFLVFKNIDSIVKSVVETAGTEVVGTQVQLDSAKVTWREGRGELHGLTIANPPNFSAASAFSLGNVALDIDLNRSSADVIVLNEILVTDAHLLAEQKLTDVNLQQLLNNVKSNSGTAGQTSSTSSEASEGKEIRLAVEKFSLENIEMRILTDQWGERTLTMPAVNLTNIGSPEKGLTPEEMAEAILTPILAQAKKAAEKELKALARKEAESKLKENLSDEDAEKLDQLKSLFGK
ncbi:hypothetical protein G8770_07620 [Aestuariicella hydrocarbonica]|uniref:AsmA domain-containing protein n=1 Tax=Pseudomaricurvus hydrocarbonicus TaxID=1470433 RepID=A0A9E5JU84_9GAMM|nr:hypothetical protein [Aestuariicella hydrocarbonica]NHO65404.1 hypothetical protein [Aestuariicella hydrocarbonica]